jgi:uncharacterized protein YbaP (TraB family)
MTRKILLPLSVLLSWFISCASGTGPEIAADSANSDVVVEDGNSLLWKIEGNGCVTSYMYGTMHMIDAEYYKMTKVMTDKIASSKAIIMEVGGMPNPLEAMSMMMLDSGTVHQYFTKEQMARLLEFMDTEMGVTPEAFHKTYGPMKPFFILQSLSQGYFGETTESYDLNIMGMAAAGDIPLVGLETIEQQLGFFESIPQSEVAEMIMSSVENYEQEKKDTQKMMKIYAEQQVEKLIPLMNKQSPEFMEYADIFLYNRNKAWIPKIKDEISDKQCFIAVGAGHLFGDGGLIDLLKKEGYTLTAISTEQGNENLNKD